MFVILKFCGEFSLTPALSRWERENGSRSLFENVRLEHVSIHSK
jgi:hypothetical protein